VTWWYAASTDICGSTVQVATWYRRET
jgi:hypothetical protein